MYKIGIAGDASAVAEELRLLAPNPEIFTLTEIGGIKGHSCDILVLNEPAELPDNFRADAVVVNSDVIASVAKQSTVATNVTLKAAPFLFLTYGLNRKASITASGFGDGHCSICVQRAFKTPWGKSRERQEFIIPTRNPAAALAAISAALSTNLETLFF